MIFFLIFLVINASFIAITGFSVTISVSVTTQPSTDNDTSLSVTTVKNFTIPYTFQETVDDCVSHGGFASAGCPWNDPEKWQNGTVVNDPTCVATGGIGSGWILPSGESCCPYFSTQKSDSPVGCSDYMYQTVTMDPMYAGLADGNFVIPDYVPIGGGEWQRVDQECVIVVVVVVALKCTHQIPSSPAIRSTFVDLIFKAVLRLLNVT